MISKIQFKNIRWAWGLAAILLMSSQVAWAHSGAVPIKNAHYGGLSTLYLGRISGGR